MLQNIGAILAKKGDSEEALSTLEQALSLWRTLGNRRAEAACLNLLGAIEKQLQRWSSSKEHILEALAIQREISDRVGEAESLLALARLNRAREENSLALELIENAVSILESVRSEIRRDELRSGFLSSRRVYYEFFVDLLMDSDRAHSKADVEAKAFHTTERARARLLLDILSDGKLKRGISPDLLERLTSLQRRINLTDRERLRLLDRKSQNQRIVVLERDLDDMLKELDTVRAEIRARSPKYAALTQPEPLRAEEIQALLGPDDLLLSYFLGEERGFVWAVTRSSLIAKDLPPGNEIESAARELHDLLSQSDKRLARKPTEQAASRLAGMILKKPVGHRGRRSAPLRPLRRPAGPGPPRSAPRRRA
jgi:tetratricopeptide (TPR) repeat protein